MLLDKVSGQPYWTLGHEMQVMSSVPICCYKLYSGALL